MTRGDPGTRRETADSPLVWNVAGLLGEGVGAMRDYAFRDVTIDPGDFDSFGVVADLVGISPEDEEAGVIRLSDHHELDLEPAIREAILLAEPIAPLDREDCPGLCIVCGLPLDEGEHDHPDEDIDPRLEALKGFRVEE